MKYIKTKNLYKASNVCLSLNPLEATSYGYWIFVKKINGKVIFNDYRFSQSTSKHQYRVRSKLEELGIKIDLYIASPKGLQNLNSALVHYKYLISELSTDLLTKNRRAETKKNQLEQLKELKKTLKFIEKLIAKGI